VEGSRIETQTRLEYCLEICVILNTLVMPSSVLKVELSSLGGMKTLPYIVMFVMSNVGGLAGDWLILQRKMSIGAGRKVVNTIGVQSSCK
jgi:hypothetical protein